MPVDIDIQSILTQLIELLLSYLDTQQLTTAVFVLGVSWALRPLVSRALDNLAKRMPVARWSRDFFVLLRRTINPLILLLLVSLVLEIYYRFEWQAHLLLLVQRVASVWTIYALLATLADLTLSSDKAKFLTKRILLPFAIVVGGLYMFGLLDPILSWGFTIESIRWRLTVGSVLLALLILSIFVALSRWARVLLTHSFLPKVGIEPPLTQTISQIVAYVIIFSGLLIALNSIGIDLTTITVIAGGLSVGLAFGLQTIFENLISGFILLFERSVQPGDVVQVDEHVGTVQKIDIRSTSITTRDNVELIIPNSYFLSQVVTNMTRSERLVRVRVNVGVSYSAKPRQVEEALLEAAQDHPLVEKQPPPSVQFVDFGDNSLNFTLFVWTTEAFSTPKLTSDLRYNIWDALEIRNIEIPFPQRDIHIRSGVPWNQLAATLPASSPNDQSG